MRIDLHCHTKKIKAGDGEGRNVTAELFQSKIMNSDVKIVAITNHNMFDYEQYIAFQQAVESFCSIWPGVEIDIKGSNGRKYHLIVVGNPDNAQAFSKGVSDLFIGKRLETCELSIEEVYTALNQFDVIYIAHFHKSPAISEEDRIKLQNLVSDSSRIFCETSDHRSLGVFANHNFSVLIGSDVKDWNHYEDSTFSELRLPVENFSQFCLLAKRDNVVVETLLNKKQAYELIASPYKGIRIPLRIYSDVNIIFGQKGTGKSEIIKSLYQNLLSQGLSCEKYTGSEKDEDFNDLLKTKDMEQDLTKVNAESCEQSFNRIFAWNDCIPTLFSNYCNWLETKDNNANKSRMKITEAVNLGEPNLPKLQSHTQDHINMNCALRATAKIDFSQYLSTEDTEILTKLIERLRRSIEKDLKYDIIEKYAYQLADYSIKRIKAHADRNSDTVSKPSSTGFQEFARGRLKLKGIIETILQNLEANEFNDKEYLGELEGKGKIYINKRYRMLCSSSKTTEFSGGITNLREIVTLLKEVQKNIFKTDLSSTLARLIEKCSEMKISSLKPFLGLSKQIVLESGDEYKPSNGERGILLLQQKLGKEADAYFLDEPELGMGNSYIDQNIRPIVTSLAKRHKVVVIATHNANLAVRTLPYMSIFRVHQNGEYTTYIGNPFNDMLVNIADKEDTCSWTLESMHTLEGGKEAFYERKNIYESHN